MCAEDRKATLTTSQIRASNKYLYIYVGLTVGLMILTFLGNISFASFTLSISKRLHNNMLQTLLRTAMRFFDTTPQGRILNRLSKDTNSVDQQVLQFSQGAMSTFIYIIGLLISMACVNWPALIVIIPCLIIFLSIFFVFRLVYPQVKRLESVTRSPVFNIVQETVDCLVTVRAFDIGSSQTDMFREAVMFNSSLFLQQFGMIRWLYFRLSVLTSGFTILVVVVSILIAPINSSIAEYAGVIISNGYSISYMLMDFVITLVSLEGEMSSVERLIEYGNLPEEGTFYKDADTKLDKEWPRTDKGISVEHLNFKYRPELDLTLKDVSFKLNPKEHVGIVGRTGAGKSSITVAMYRLAEPDKGS